MNEPMQNADMGPELADRTSRPTVTSELPELIKAKLRPQIAPARSTPAFGGIVARVRSSARAAVSISRDKALPLLRQAAAMVPWGKVALPKMPPHVRDGLVERGRSAGMQIGTTLDKIVRPVSEAPAADEKVAHDRVLPDEPDVSTIALRRSVKQPSIFAPGHILTAVLAGGIIHIATTFAITALGTGSAYRQLRSVLPVNEIVVLPELQAGQQILPYLAPDMLYALCRFDLAHGPVAINAVLPEAGWSLALYNRQGDNFYAAPGTSQRPVPVAFLLEPASDRLVNLQPGVRKNNVNTTEVTSPDGEGLVVIRAPLKGIAYQASTLADLKRATCTQVKR